MMRIRLIFFLAGVIAGVVTAVAGQRWPAFLAFGVGPVFFLAVFAAIKLTGAWSSLNHGFLRILGALCICTFAYVLALLTFGVVSGYWAELLRIRVSADVRLSVDLWIGLLAAALVASACIAYLAYVLTGGWSSSFLFGLAAAGVLTVAVTFVVSHSDHSYWRFFGVLLPLGEGLFCAAIGEPIRKVSEHSTVPAG